MSKSKLPLCIWHKGCIDGFTSAWVANRFFEGAVDFHEGVYGEDPPDVTDRYVLMVDFSYPQKVIAEMGRSAERILIVDHHRTAKADLQPWVHEMTHDLRHPHPLTREIRAYFDMERSGAGMTWDFFYPDARRPRLVQHVEDRDLWRFQLENTREINAALYSYDFEFDVWTYLVDRCESDARRSQLIAEGAAIMRAHAKERAQLINGTMRMMTIGGVSMPVCCAPWFHASEIGNELALSHQSRAAATYHDESDGRRKFSLRSAQSGPDVSEIAKKYGGGGHRNAAGFTAPNGWEGEAVLPGTGKINT